MSVNRDYLPFKSARHYQDRKMAKWMGFFLSEHSSALNQLDDGIDFDAATPFNEKIALLSQLFANQLSARFTVQKGKRLEIVTGKMTQMVDSKIGVSTETGYHFIEMNELLSIQLIPEEADTDDEP